MKKKVLIGMSGGVDSSVSAYLLKEQGYEVIGVTMNLWSFEEYGGDMVTERGCCSLEAFKDARLVCKAIEIPHYVLNFRDIFRECVVKDFINEYEKGFTPNPCVLCNTLVKWEALLKKADMFECDYLATGHYADINFNKESGRYEIIRGADTKKDQSYFLYGIKQDALSRTLFPLASVTKDKVREIAKKLDLQTAEKKESMEICFIPDNDYRRFLIENSSKIKEIKDGEIYYLNGEKLNRKHDGYPFYTIGQRKGLGGGFKEPMYVAKIDSKTNSIYIGNKSELMQNDVVVSYLNWVSFEIKDSFRCSAKIRFNMEDKSCIVTRRDENSVVVTFDEPVFGVTPGQSAVFYDKNRVIGGGLIIK